MFRKFKLKTYFKIRPQKFWVPNNGRKQGSINNALNIQQYLLLEMKLSNLLNGFFSGQYEQSVAFTIRGYMIFALKIPIMGLVHKICAVDASFIVSRKSRLPRFTHMK